MSRRAAGVRPTASSGDRSVSDVGAETPGPVREVTARPCRPPPRSSARSQAPSPASQTSLPELADVGEVAEWLRTTPKAIYALVERAQLPGAIRIGRRLLFDRAVLVRWLSERRVPSPQEQRQ
jgi:predicted DNA-binding transcriptional regulator AlpA